jgi:hypothetical protein
MLARWLAVGLGVALLAASARSAPVPAAEKELDAKTKEKIKKLQLKRRDVLKEAMRIARQEYEMGRQTSDALLDLGKELLQAELDVATKAEERLAAHTAYLEVARKTEAHAKVGYEAGRMPARAYLRAQAVRLEAEVGWLKAGGKARK